MRNNADSLQMAALRYAAGELPPLESAAFEAQLSHCQQAREALAEAVRLSAAALGQPAPSPEPSMRGLLVDRLRPVGSYLSGLWCRRAYRGHPAAWAGAGATLAATVVAMGVMANGTGTTPTGNTIAITYHATPPVNAQACTTAPAPVPVPNSVVPAVVETTPMSSTRGATAGGGEDINRTTTPGTTFVPPEPFPHLPGMEMSETRP